MAQRAALAHIVAGMVQRRPDLLRVADALLSSVTVRPPLPQSCADRQSCHSYYKGHQAQRADPLACVVQPVTDNGALV